MAQYTIYSCKHFWRLSTYILFDESKYTASLFSRKPMHSGHYRLRFNQNSQPAAHFLDRWGSDIWVRFAPALLEKYDFCREQYGAGRRKNEFLQTGFERPSKLAGVLRPDFKVSKSLRSHSIPSLCKSESRPFSVRDETRIVSNYTVG